MPPNDEAAERAEREAEAQLAIIRALKPLAAHQRYMVMHAIDHIIQAEACAPGVFDALARGLEEKPDGV